MILKSLISRQDDIGAAVADRIGSATDRTVGTKRVKNVSVLSDLQAESVQQTLSPGGLALPLSDSQSRGPTGP